MKNMFNMIVIVASLVVGYIIWQFIFGAEANMNPDHTPKNFMGNIYTGGPLVAGLLAAVPGAGRVPRRPPLRSPTACGTAPLRN